MSLDQKKHGPECNTGLNAQESHEITSKRVNMRHVRGIFSHFDFLLSFRLRDGKINGNACIVW